MQRSHQSIYGSTVSKQSCLEKPVRWFLISLAITFFFAHSERLSADDTGKKVYAAKCASCHGAAGEGNANHFADPLQGDLSVSELVKLISETMPEDEPGDCVAEEAQLVGQYIFDNFYSIEAQRRLAIARVELSRLTVRQYRESVADLIGTFGNPFWIPEERGLEADYFAARHWTDKKRLWRRHSAF